MNHPEFEPPHVSVTTYITGFVSCLLLTGVAYLLTTNDAVSRQVVLYAVGGLAIVQCFVQLVLFLHLGQEARPRHRLMVFSVMLTIMLIVVVGSIWIMDNLNYHMMDSPVQTQRYVSGQDGL